MLELRLDGISKRYGSKILFQEFSHCFSGGKITMLRGCNGRGKSTLLKMAGGLLLPDRGKISLWEDGEELSKETLSGMVGMVSPELGVYGKMTAAENLRFFTELRGQKISQQEIAESLSAAGLTESPDWVESFSTGMRQRLKFAILISSRSRIDLLDEPLSNLDEAGRNLASAIARRAADQGKIVLWATNEAQEEGFADELLHLE